MTGAANEAGVAVEDSTISIQGTNCCLHTWRKISTNDEDSKEGGGGNDDTTTATATSKGLVLIFHGFGAHGKYPTVRYAAERLAAASYIVVAPDLPGHGSSDGLSGYISNDQTLLNVGIEIVNHVKEKYQSAIEKKFFLLGSSMGGTISLAVAQKLKKLESSSSSSSNMVTGVVLLAPMLMLSVGSATRYLLSTLAMLPGISTAALIPSNSTSSEQQYRDPNKRKECEDDKLSYSGNMRVGSASACVEMASYIQSQFCSIEFPFLLMVADEDVVVKNQGSFDLMEKSPSKDKTMKQYPALHGLLCEPKPLITQIEDDMVRWIDAH